MLCYVFLVIGINSISTYLWNWAFVSTVKLLKPLHSYIVDLDLPVRCCHPNHGSTWMEIQMCSKSLGFLKRMDFFSTSQIKKTICFIIRNGCHNLVLGWKLGTSNPAVMSHKRIDEFVLRNGPNLDRFILRGCDNLLIVRAEVHTSNGRCVGFEIWTATLNIIHPKTYCPVSRTRCQQIARRREFNTRYRTRMTNKPSSKRLL